VLCSGIRAGCWRLLLTVAARRLWPCGRGMHFPKWSMVLGPRSCSPANSPGTPTSLTLNTLSLQRGTSEMCLFQVPKPILFCSRSYRRALGRQTHGRISRIGFDQRPLDLQPPVLRQTCVAGNENCTLRFRKAAGCYEQSQHDNAVMDRKTVYRDGPWITVCLPARPQFL
jgi:hypothetical protein